MVMRILPLLYFVHLVSWFVRIMVCNILLRMHACAKYTGPLFPFSVAWNRGYNLPRGPGLSSTSPDSITKNIKLKNSIAHRNL